SRGHIVANRRPGYPGADLSDLAERQSVGALAEICGTGKRFCVAKAEESPIPIRKSHAQTCCRPTARRAGHDSSSHPSSSVAQSGSPTVETGTFDAVFSAVNSMHIPN